MPPHHHHHGSGSIHPYAFAVGIGLNLAFVVAEAAAGFISGSLALLADAGHNLSDVLGLVVAWGASRLARKPPSLRRTYGLRRSTIVAAQANATILLLAIGGIAWEAIHRLTRPAPTEGMMMILVAGIGVLINGITARLFWRGRHHDLNIRGAFWHMTADAAVSLGVVLAGLLIHRTGLLWIDPLVSLAIVAVIAVSTWGLLRESFDLALDAVPRHVDPAAVRRYLEALPGIVGVHELHIWATSTTEVALTVHLIKPDPRGDDQLLMTIMSALREDFGIAHPTIQWERAGG
ncbi:MAG: cation diffusion facilitator family transporter [Candidatus Eisenbacteria bacterium]